MNPNKTKIPESFDRFQIVKMSHVLQEIQGKQEYVSYYVNQADILRYLYSW